ncbi:MAG: PAS domain S-box protein [SAR202 cluster bacterium]|nr:PAS domain S-box protein [SAR202 cluster bacterium]
MAGTVHTQGGHSTGKEGLRRERPMLGPLFELMPMWAQVCDPHGNIKQVNQAAVNISGYSREELTGAAWPYPWLQPAEQDSVGSVPSSLPAWPYAMLRASGKPVEFSVNCRTRSGQVRNLGVTASLLPDSAGGDQVLLLCWDMTQRSHEENRRQENAKIQVVNQLAAGVAHDINNNLAVFWVILSSCWASSAVPKIRSTRPCRQSTSSLWSAPARSAGSSCSPGRCPGTSSVK